MKISIISFVLSCMIFFSAQAQVPAASQNIKAQATKMANALLAEDYKTFAKYTYPKILQAVGGADKMASMLSNGTVQMKSQGMSFSKIALEDPSKIVAVGKELQSTITQHLTIKASDGNLVTTSTLIAFSSDNGVNWTFVDASNKDPQTLKKMLPNLSPTIVIPAPQQPVRTN